jgi:ribosomal protein S18 acetylase RimI-like enzyme
MPAAARLLHDFNVEFGDPTPPPDELAGRVRRAVAHDASVLLASLDGGEAPDAVAVLRFRPSLWAEGLECYLAELYVVPDKRGRGLGHALLQEVLDHARGRGAGYIDLGTDETDTAARALYESLGFDNHSGRPDGPVSYYYERDL